jgi:hypothetical protein
MQPLPLAILSQTRYGDASIDTYDTIILGTLSIAGNKETWIPMPVIHWPPALEKVLSLLLEQDVPPASLERHLYFVLEKGGEEVRLSMLAAVKHAIRFVMGTEKGAALFDALLDTYDDFGEEPPEELMAIVQAMTADNDDNGFLERNIKDECHRYVPVPFDSLLVINLFHFIQ